MRFAIGHALCVSTLVLIAGCSGAARVAPPAATADGPGLQSLYGPTALTVAPSGAVSPVSGVLLARARHPERLRMSPAKMARRGFTYVSQFTGTPVQEYHLQNKANGAAICALPGESVNGIAVDPHGNVWVPSGTGGGQGYTDVYSRVCGHLEKHIVSPNGQPADAGFDSKGNAYILNIFDANGEPGSVNVYNKRGTVTGSLTDPTFSELIGIGTDSHDDIFVSNRNASGVAGVVEFAGGKMPGTVLNAITLGLPGAPELDASDNLIITDWNALTLNVYAPPYTGAPAVTPMQGLSLWCALSHNEKLLSCADLGNGSVDVYAYPGAAYLYSYTNGLSPSGFASGSADRPAAPL